MKKEETPLVKLYGMVLCYNESKMIPLIMPYFERMGFDKLYVYDNESTDNSVELLKQYPFVEIRTFKTKGLEDNVNKDIKGNFFKEFSGITESTWLYIADFDEVIYFDGNFKEYLTKKDKQGYTCLNHNMFELLSEKFPKLKDGQLVHEVCDGGYFWEDTCGCKVTLFKVNGVSEVKYTPGAHCCKIISTLPKKSLNSDKNIRSFHIKYIGHAFNRAKVKKQARRRSRENRKHNFGIQYEWFRKTEKFEEEWKRKLGLLQPVSDYLSGKLKPKRASSRRLKWKYPEENEEDK